MNGVKDCYSLWLDRLRRAGVESAGFELDLLLETVCSISKKERLLSPKQALTPEQTEQMERLLSRREAGEPLQYLLGWWEFYGRCFRVGPGVLIPRPDTERLVEWALEELERVPSPKVADLCAGSGCIGLTVACERPDAQVFLLEVSPQAAAYCDENRKIWAPGCTLFQTDVLKGTQGLTGLDAVLSNPPYIPSADLSSLGREVKHEPQLALDGAADGLCFYREIPPLWKDALKPGGLLAFEIGFDQAQAVCALLENADLEKIRVEKDYGGNNRVALARKPLR